MFFASEDTHNYYYPIKDSVKLLECLLDFQFGNDNDTVNTVNVFKSMTY